MDRIKTSNQTKLLLIARIRYPLVICPTKQGTYNVVVLFPSLLVRYNYLPYSITQTFNICPVKQQAFNNSHPQYVGYHVFCGIGYPTDM